MIQTISRFYLFFIVVLMMICFGIVGCGKELNGSDKPYISPVQRELLKRETPETRWDTFVSNMRVQGYKLMNEQGSQNWVDRYYKGSFDLKFLEIKRYVEKKNGLTYIVTRDYNSKPRVLSKSTNRGQTQPPPDKILGVGDKFPIFSDEAVRKSFFDVYISHRSDINGKIGGTLQLQNGYMILNDGTIYKVPGKCIIDYSKGGLITKGTIEVYNNK